MTPLEIFAVLLSLVSVVLSVKRHVITWPTGILGVAAYFVLFVQNKLYADATLQIVFCAQNAYGWWYWTRKDAHETVLPVTTLSTRDRLLVAGAIALCAALIGAALKRWTDAAFPFVDPTLSIASLVANQLLARKVLDNWVIWIAADIGYVIVFWLKGLHLSAGLYVVFMALSVAGLLEWMKARVVDA